MYICAKFKTMKKFILYFLLFLLIAGLATLAYGFWNGKNIRLWAKAAAEIKTKSDLSIKEKNIAGRLESAGGKKMEDLKAELAGFSSDLKIILKELEKAKRETENIAAPRAVEPARAELIDFYSTAGQQIKNIANIGEFMNRLLEVAAIFDSMNSDAKLSEIQAMIAEAKAKNSEINADNLPEETRSAGDSLKRAMDDFLEALDQFAAGKTEENERLNSTYADFSKKGDDFFSAAKKYAGSLRDMEIAGKKINEELMILERIKFSVK